MRVVSDPKCHLHLDSPDSAIWQQNCFLKAHRWLQLGSVLYIY